VGAAQAMGLGGPGAGLRNVPQPNATTYPIPPVDRYLSDKIEHPPVPDGHDWNMLPPKGNYPLMEGDSGITVTTPNDLLTHQDDERELRTELARKHMEKKRPR